MLAGCEAGLRLINFPQGSQARKPLELWQESSELFSAAKYELNAYFNEKLTHFSIPVILEGTIFQKQVWQALQNIPFGQLASYGEIAKSIGKPGAARAVGGANNANPLPIIVPCHRIIGANKSLTGFGGGLGIKRFLINLEAQVTVSEFSLH